MKQLKYELGFATPAFLGNADQNAQWRTPPIKALIRQWWRVAYAADHGFKVDLKAMWREEGQLFGAASDKAGGVSLKSRVLLRLKHWDAGQLGNDKWPKEMSTIQVGQGRVRADLYLGYGPIAPASTKQNRSAPTVDRRAIDPKKQRNELFICFDRETTEAQRKEVLQAIKLLAWFGGVGSRSRNGWGSLTLQGNDLPVFPQSSVDIDTFCRPFESCFDQDWPHAIGKDKNGALAWTGRWDGGAFKDWREAVIFLAGLRRDIRAAAKTFGRNQDISANQLIAYPVTNANNNRWGNDERIAGSLRLKVLQTEQGFIPIAIHLPCAVPKHLFEKLVPADRHWINDQQVAIWAKVHEAIGQKMTRLGKI